MPMPTPAEIEALRDLCQTRPGELNIAPVAAIARRINAANGWVPEWSLKQIPTLTALIHTEFKEARDEIRDENREQLLEELADIIIRCLDTVELVLPEWAGKLQLPPYADQGVGPNSVPGQLLWLSLIRDSVDEATEHYRKVMDEEEMKRAVAHDLAWVAQRVTFMMQTLGGDPVDVLVRVLLRNRERGKRHGGRRA